jgi:transcriptional regulator with XRE-family HTH domain
MSIQVQVALRSRKLGVLIRDARLAAHKSIPECAQLVGVTSDILLSWEEGENAPSLLELEVFAYALHLHLSHFYGKAAISVDDPISERINLPALVGIRQRLVGALLRKQREIKSVSLQTLSDQSGISTERLEGYELGEYPVPLPELEGLVALLGGQIETFFDQTSPVGQWMTQQKAVQDFLQLTPDLQSFVSKPVNRPYLELAMKLSGMSTDKLRSVAEDLLEITF